MTSHTKPDPWWTRGACRDMPKHEIDRLFFPRVAGTRSGTIDRQAKQICRQCPVILDCLRYAIQAEILIGTYGGMTDLERRNRFHNGRRVSGGRSA